MPTIDLQIIPFVVSEVHIPPADRELFGREWWPSYAHAVVHRDGVFLFDNGAGFGNAEINETFTPRVTPIEEALAEYGISLADLTGEANCHLHFDHAGQNARLPRDVPIFIQRPEWEMVHKPDYTIVEWVDAPGLTYEVLDGQAEVAPGLRLVPTPGHTAGHQSLVLDAAEGTIVLAGQALQSLREWEGATEPSASGLREGPLHEPYVASVGYLRVLQPVRVHFAHDPAVWQR